jgi:hypothetical protein
MHLLQTLIQMHERLLKDLWSDVIGTDLQQGAEDIQGLMLVGRVSVTTGNQQNEYKENQAQSAHIDRHHVSPTGLATASGDANERGAKPQVASPGFEGITKLS